MCCKSINKSVSLFHTQFALDLFFFFKQFQSLVFIKFFLIQKSKSSTNLNHKEGNKTKQLSICEITKIWNSRGKNISGVIYLCDYFPGGSLFGTICPRGNYVGDKSSERQFSSGAISRRILSVGNFLLGNFLEAIIRGRSPGGQFSSEAIIQGGRCPGRNHAGAIFRG